MAALEQAATAAQARGFTRKEYVERFIAAVTLHEIGHTLGLRHNFKGSLAMPASSIMDYNTEVIDVAMGATPGSYDSAAVRYLYGISTTLPTQPFCTDPQADLDPDCRRWDQGATPLVDHYIPEYKLFTDDFLSGGSTLCSLPRRRHGSARADGGQSAGARDRLRRRPGAAARALAGRGNPQAREFHTQQLLERLFVRPLPVRGLPPEKAPPAQPPVEPVLSAAATDLEAMLSDGTRSMPNRRLSADLLKKFQSAVAFTALTKARENIVAQAAALTGPAAIEHKDLVGRIDRHLSAYFD